MGSSSSRITIGYKYYLGMHLGLCHGPIDKVTMIEVDGRVAWEGEADSDTPAAISQPNLFGGDEREGGVSGTVSFAFGEPDQQPNAYLMEQLGADIPAFRGVACAVLEQVYTGNNPYLKPWSFTAQRIHVRQDGLAQWYDEKAEIDTRIAVSGSRLYLSFDASDSLTGADFARGKQAVIATLEALSRVATDDPYFIQLVAFSDDSEVVTKQSTPQGFAELIAFVEDVEQEFGTSADVAFGPALTFFDYNQLTGTGRNLLVCMSDGIFHDTTADFFADTIFQDMIDKEESPWATEDGTDVTIKCFGIANIGELVHFDNTGTDIEVIEAGGLDSGGVASRVLDLMFGTITEGEMNPAHIIRECLTDPNWGMGYNDADIDDDYFMAAADQLYDEQFGLSFVWSKEGELVEFVNEVLRHIDATLFVHRETGKFCLKLVRPEDADTSMVVLNESNVISVKNANRPAVADLVASVTVNYWDRNTGEPGSITKHNQALFEVQTGGGGSATVDYPGITSRNLAARVCLRDMRTLSTPLLRCSIEVTRVAEELNIGDAFVLDWPDLGIDSLVMRVQQMVLGDGDENTIVIEAIEDAFSLPQQNEANVGGQEDLWTDPADSDVAQVDPRIVSEVPYYELLRSIGSANTSTMLEEDPDAGVLLVAGSRQGMELNAQVWTDSGAGYENRNSMDFCPSATLVSYLFYTDTTVYIQNGKDIDLIELGTEAQIGEELVRVDSIDTDSNGQFVTVGRGVLDTTPARHSAGDTIIFWGSEWSSDGEQYTASDEINVQLRTTLGGRVLEDPATDTVIMDSRAVRPYPPGDLRVDGDSYPTAIEFDYTNTLTWTHRDRLTQTDDFLYDYTAGDIGPEAGTTYRVIAEAILENTDVVEFADDTTASTSYTFTGLDSNVSPLPSQTEFVRLKVFSVRDGYESWQAASVVIPPAPFSGADEELKYRLETITLSSAGEFDFDNIPSGYARLIIEGYVRSTGGGGGDHDKAELFFNSDTTPGNYHTQTIYVLDGVDSSTDLALPHCVWVPNSNAETSGYGFVRIVIEGYDDTSIIRCAIGNFATIQATDSLLSGISATSHHSMTAAITQLRLRANNHPTNGLVGTLHLYGES